MAASPCNPSSSNAPVELDFDLSLYRLAAIQKAAHRFSGSYLIELARVQENQVRVRLTPRPDAAPSTAPAELANEVLDQELRELVAEETRSVRDLLLAQAFSNLPLTDPIGEHADFRDDPLNIAESQRP